MENNVPNPVIRLEFGCSDKVKMVTYYADISEGSTGNAEAQAFLKKSPNIKERFNPYNEFVDDNCVTIHIELDDSDEPMLQNNFMSGTRLVGPVAFPNKQKYAWVRVMDDNIIRLLTKV